MVLKLLFVLLVSSVVIASENPCDNVEGGIPRKASYVKFNGGFFFIHSITNGESVVMYQIPDDKKINVQYTFINDDCLYETQSYNIIENKSFVDHAQVLEKPEDFLIRKTLSFDVDGKPVEIKFKINKTGLAQDIGFQQVKRFVSKNSTKEINPSDLCSKGELVNGVSKIEFYNKNSTELKYLKNGRFFYQELTDSIDGKYAFKTKRGGKDFYDTFHYKIENLFESSFMLTEKTFLFKDIDKFNENVCIDAKNQGVIENTCFCFDSTGVRVIKNTSITGGLSLGSDPPTNTKSMSS